MSHGFSEFDAYQSPLSGRNASAEMLAIWSPRHKFNLWRNIWLSLAQAQHASGLPVSAAQVAELRGVVSRGITDDEIIAAQRHERTLRHDVMAHVHTLGESCPAARGIIHLGMTSQDVVCNADLCLLFEACELIERKCARAVLALCDRADQYIGVPTLGFTHYQPAQPVTVGRRCALWAHDLDLSRAHLRGVVQHDLHLRGIRGATGTQAAFLALMGPSLEAGSNALEREAATGFSRSRPQGTYELSGQTYPRVVDCFVLGALAAIAAVLHKIGSDIRLLCNRKEVDEPFETKQIGSSAMPYKRNPMRCERMCGLTRFVMNLPGNALDTAAVQWLERTLDDSSNRRLSLPEAFLALDGALDIMDNVGRGLVVHEATVRKNLMDELPFMATENILMAAVQAGGDRQEYHEIIREHAQAAGMRVKTQGGANDLLERLAQDTRFSSRSRGGPLARELDWSDVMNPHAYTGLSVQQTTAFTSKTRAKYETEYGAALAEILPAELKV
jgi:adenylosuccinate lyase